MADVLNATDLANLRRGLQHVTNAEDIIRRARAAGLPVDEVEQEVRSKRQIFESVLREFFPGQT